MKNLIKLDTKEVELLKRDDDVQVWVTAKGHVRITQRIQLGSCYAIIKLNEDVSSIPADTMYKDELLRLIEDNKWTEIEDAIICRESDVKELLE